MSKNQGYYSQNKETVWLLQGKQTQTNSQTDRQTDRQTHRMTHTTDQHNCRNPTVSGN